MKSLRKFILETVRATKSYMKKEEIRENLQALITSRVSSGDIRTQEDLDTFFRDVQMASRTLKDIPIEVFKKLSKSS